jgi:hypothetical protein
MLAAIAIALAILTGRLAWSFAKDGRKWGIVAIATVFLLSVGVKTLASSGVKGDGSPTEILGWIVLLSSFGAVVGLFSRLMNWTVAKAAERNSEFIRKYKQESK